MVRTRAGRVDAIRKLRGSPLVTSEIPAPLRALDLAIVVLAAPFALVLGSVLALAVWLDSPGPVLYRSRRIGRGGRPFDMLKFRTMVRDASGPPLSARGDERYTPLGRTLSGSRLDELPQLINVLRGDMRLVGPRPEVEDFVREFPEEYERILSVPPGLTGPAQVEYAWEGEILARAQAVDRARVYREEILPYKLAIDLRYAERHSVAGDLWLLARTAVLPVVRAARHLDSAIGGNGLRSRTRIAGAIVLTLAIVALVGLLASEAAAPL
jgi:lipopolysaccharide/colanic/teichoic acid biosynthesis glycosyltransferase